ncbi:hypothetical protein Bpfe_029025 [Biomphalaria pfeifferi]|uniref:Uncharacterized protein n=1 Tax=Biomphalaria pfeifferi TaxID=112525 RepID=A0AAD8ATV9_BIOPF|nr:hypothetical protein Bpfe_029025 [Biomphalaria pfeifferi]
MTVREASKLTINVIMELWKKASIPTRAEQHCIQKLESVFYEWKGLQKYKSRSGEAHKKQEHEFVSHLEDLFDTAHQDALTIISNPEDRAFLLRQREKGRPGSIGVRDKVTERKARAAGERKQAEARRRQKSVDEMNISACLTTLESSSGEDSDHDQEQIAMCDDEYKPVASSSTDPACTRVPAETKKLMLAAMENAAPEHPPKRPRVETSAFTNSKGLEQFCTANSMTMFRLLQLQTSFMSKDPSEWDEDETYQCALRTVKGLAVVNDRAERGVALIQDYNKKLTKDEEQLQFMLHVVSEHRRLFPDCSKSGLMMAMSSTPTTP